MHFSNIHRTIPLFKLVIDTKVFRVEDVNGCINYVRVGHFFYYRLSCSNYHFTEVNIVAIKYSTLTLALSPECNFLSNLGVVHT